MASARATKRATERKELMKRVAEKDARTQPRNEKRSKLAGKCSAKKRDKTFCQHAAGWGTTHPGIGRCKLHGGSSPTHSLNAYKQDAIFMGAEKDINPFDAIMWCIRIKAGEIEWLTQQMAELEKKDWIEESIFGKQMHLFQRERSAAIELLAKIAKDAVSLGIAERQVRLAEQYGHSIARLLKGIQDELQLTDLQRQIWPQIIRRQLLLIETTQSISGEPVIEGKVAR